MCPMRNRHTELTCRGLHAYKQERGRTQYGAVYSHGWWRMVKASK